MKTKFSKILGVGMVVAVLASVLVISAPASAGNVSWTKDSGPSTVSNVDVKEMTVASNGTTGYVVTGDKDVDSATANIQFGGYKTTDGGKTWTKFVVADNTTAASGTTHVTVAGDSADGSILAVVVGGNRAFISTDGAVSFSEMTGFAVATINSISVGPAIGTARSVAIGGDNSTWIFTSGSAFSGGTAWTNIMASGNVTAGPALAVKFSPNYLQDRTLVVVSTDGSNTRMNLYNVATALWNKDYAVYGVGDKGSVISAGASTHAAVDVPGSYMAFDSSVRTAYIAKVGS